MVKTTMILPKELWKLAKIRAVEDESDLNRVVIAALQEFLKTKQKSASRKETEK